MENAVAELKYPIKVRLVGVTTPVMMYPTIQDANDAYTKAVEVLKDNVDTYVLDTALELMLLSKYSVYKLSCMEIGAGCMKKERYFSEWIDANIDKIPENYRLYAIEKYCDKNKRLFSNRIVRILKAKEKETETVT